jgi:hypothetical protein
MDLNSEIARLRETAKFLDDHPFLADLHLSFAPSVDCFPNHRTKELVAYLRKEKIRFEQVPLRSEAHAICIYAGGVQFWISNDRLAELSEGDTHFLLDVKVEDTVATIIPPATGSHHRE